MVKVVTVLPRDKPKTDINLSVEEVNSRWSRKSSSTMECPTRGGTELRTSNRMLDLTSHRKTSLVNDQMSSMSHRISAHWRRGGRKVSFNENSANVRHPCKKPRLNRIPLVDRTSGSRCTSVRPGEVREGGKVNEWERANHPMSDYRKGGRRSNRWSLAFLSLPVPPPILLKSHRVTGLADETILFTLLAIHISVSLWILMRAGLIPPEFLFGPQLFGSYARFVFLTVTV